MKYSLVGIIGQIIDYLITIFLVSKDLDLFISNFLGYLLGSISSYIGHTKFTFRKYSKKVSSTKQILFFILACLLGSLGGYFIINIFIFSNLNIELAKLFQLFVIAIIQYLVNSNITFNNK